MSTRNLVILLTLFSFLLWSCKAPEIFTKHDNELPRVANVHFTNDQDTVNVHYDLLAQSPNSKFNIKLMLSLGKSKTYQIDSTAASGDIGKGVLPGKNKTISWKVLNDFPQGIQGKKVQFIVDAQQENVNKNHKWLYIASGAAILTAGAILGYLYLLPGDHSLPSPPARPSGH